MENDVLELVKSMNSILKRKCTKDQYQFRKNMTPKQETNKAIKVLLEVMTIME